MIPILLCMHCLLSFCVDEKHAYTSHVFIEKNAHSMYLQYNTIAFFCSYTISCTLVMVHQIQRKRHFRVNRSINSTQIDRTVYSFQAHKQ